MSYIEINDVFEELFEENKTLKQCLKAMIEFKDFVVLVFNKINSNLNSNELKNFDKLYKNVEEVIHKNQLMKCLTDNEYNENKINKTNEEYETKMVIKPSIQRLSKLEKTVPIVPKVPWSQIGGKFICGFIGCDKKYSSRSGLYYHFNAHKPIKPYKCVKCLSQLSSKSGLKIHMKGHELSSEPLICGIDDCNKKFDNEYLLNRHKTNTHLKEKRFFCDFPNCDYKCISNGILKLHKMCHSGERPFVCDSEGCVASFRTQSALNSHKLSHIPFQNIKCIYEKCDKSFKHREGLNKHLSTVHSDTKHSCNWPGCDFVTNTHRNLRTHRLVHSNELNFHCLWPECGKSFKKKKYLNRHLRIHNNDRRYACSWPGCQYRCVFDGNLRKHMRVHQK